MCPIQDWCTCPAGTLQSGAAARGDNPAAPALRDALARAMDRRETHVIVDLTDATFADSTAIGVLLHASARIRETKGRLSLICTNRNVLRTVEIAGLERHIAVSRTPR